MKTTEEKQNERKSMYISLGIHSALLVLFFFLLAWKEPFPPIPEYGIELNFGVDNQGSGEIQQQTPTSRSPSDKPKQEIEESQPVETTNANQQNQEEAVEEPAPEANDEVITTDRESPDAREKVPEENTGDTDEANQGATPANTAIATETTSNADAGGTNQGDDKAKTGDKGKPEGELDQRALYGNPGGGGGASLNMTGWVWDYIPQPNDQSDENGRIVFSITIDDNGEILSIRTLQKTVTPAVERIYRAEVEKLTFSTTSDNTRPASSSVGTITFVIKTN